MPGPVSHVRSGAAPVLLAANLVTHATAQCEKRGVLQKKRGTTGKLNHFPGSLCGCTRPSPPPVKATVGGDAPVVATSPSTVATTGGGDGRGQRSSAPAVVVTVAHTLAECQEECVEFFGRWGAPRRPPAWSLLPLLLPLPPPLSLPLAHPLAPRSSLRPLTSH